MDLWTALRVYAARWYVAVPVLLMSFYAAYIIGRTINPTYETAGSILLVPPLDQAPAEFQNEYEPIVNPCLRPGNGPRSCADAIGRILLSEGEQRRFEAAGLSPDYDISIPRDSLIIDYTVAGDSASQVTETLDELVRRTNSELLSIQQTTSTPADQIISVEPLYLAEEPEEFSGGRLKVTVALALVGVVASASIAFLVDNLAGRRGGTVRRAVRTEPTATAGPAASAVTTTRTESRRRIELVADEDDDWAADETGLQDPTTDEIAQPTTRRRVRRRSNQPADSNKADSNQADSNKADRGSKPAPAKKAAAGPKAKADTDKADRNKADRGSKPAPAKKAAAGPKAKGDTDTDTDDAPAKKPATTRSRREPSTSNRTAGRSGSSTGETSDSTGDDAKSSSTGAAKRAGSRAKNTGSRQSSTPKKN